MPDPRAAAIELSVKHRAQLESLTRARSPPQALALRCRSVLRAAEGNPTNQTIADELHCNRHTVGKWREHFRERGLDGLQEAPRSGRPRSFSPR